MTNLKKIYATLALSALASATSVQAQDTIKLGISAPMSGAAAVWGLGMEWTAKQAADKINLEGGVTVAGKKYKFEIVAYDNKYNAAEGTKVAQNLINRDKIKYIVGGIGTAPIQALQSLSERSGTLIFISAWGKSVKGPQFPLTFTQSNTPFEILDPLYKYVLTQHPKAKTVAILNANDASGKEVEVVAQKAWAALGVKVLSTNWYERGTTQFQPIAAKLTEQKPDIIDLGVAPPADAGIVLKELGVLGWNGVKVLPVGTSATQLAQIGGAAANGTYMGYAGDYSSSLSTPVQQILNQGMLAQYKEPLNPLQVSSYDSVYALKAAMESANSLDPKKIAEVLPTLIFETSYGKTVFGSKAVYDSPQQMQVPVMITQVQDGKMVELTRLIPEELKARLAAGK
ncbi:MAG: ABC transporter substrate-binding protein [Alcaligenaceae bacterium]